MVTDSRESSPLALHRIPNGLVVMLAVSLLLQGPVGAFEALWAYSRELLGTLLGGEQVFWEVLCQTAPLTIATAVIVFAYRCNWLKLTSPISVVVASVLVLAGTLAGDELRMLIVKARTHSIAKESKDGIPVLAVSMRSETRVLMSDHSIPDLKGDPDSTSNDEVESITIATAIERLTDFQSTATDSGNHRWTQNVPRVNLLAERGTVGGIVARAVNQLLGYFVVYRPRLFLAAILLGGYIGWSWQPYVESLRSYFRRYSDRTDSDSKAPVNG